MKPENGGIPVREKRKMESATAAKGARLPSPVKSEISSPRVALLTRTTT